AEKVADQEVWTDFTAIEAAIHFYCGQFDRMEEYWQKFLAIFQRNINQGREASVEKAVAWHREVTPFRHSSRLQRFWDHRLGKSSAASKAPAPTPETIKGSLVQIGDHWQMEYLGSPTFIGNCKGMHDIARLLERSETPLHCTDLMGTLLDHSGIPLADGQALREIRNRVSSLEAEMAEAQEMGDFQRRSEERRVG